MQRDRFGLRRRILALKAESSKDKLAAIKGQVEKSQQRFQFRLQNLPKPRFPEELPVVERKQDIAEAIANNQVVILCGETGSGKTTQLPKICLELGRGVGGLIGHTQPRRIAARSVATRIAHELESAMGHVVGYKVRFSDHLSENTYVKLMTDGILLAETQGDRFLDAYDTLIIDEAHERSLNIDFLLGYIRKILPRRPDLKVIITSATIDPQRFSGHFNDAPVIEVSGRTYPVDILYRPLSSNEGDDGKEGSDDKDMQQAVLDAVDELARHGPGDVLVFLAGERDIRETAEALRKHHPPQTEILPLFARLSATEQERIFKSHGGRRIVLSTNVAETSLTVPGIRYVVDTGLARISRYSYRTKIQRLPIERVSQASANQRAGRCGRVSAGVCIRLYSEEDYLSRDEFTQAEILRTNLASVILQMMSLGFGDVRAFPFVDVPDERFINDGFKLLHELGAIDQKNKLTPVGRSLSRFPIDPRLARMLLEAHKQGCLKEVLVIVAGLSVQDPRERPFDSQQAADEKHRRFHDEQSDFLSLLKLWQYLEKQRKELSGSKFRKMCRAEYISYMRTREWREVYTQLKKQLLDQDMKLNTNEPSYESVHCALLSGLLSRIGMKDENNEYLGARGTRFFVFPGSGLHKKSPKWLMSAEIVETAKVFARMVAKIEPAWIELLAKHLVKRRYFEPHWEKRNAQVAGFESVTLYGLPIVAKRKINFGPVDPVVSRELFVRHALVQGEYRTGAPFFKHNRDLIEGVEELEAKSRRQDILVDEELLYAFFDKIIPPNIYSGHQFEKWRKSAERENKQLLYLKEEDLMQHQAGGVTEARFPSQLNFNGIVLDVEYQFAPGIAGDGVSIRVPVAVLNQLHPQRFEWLVPGLLEDKIVAMIKSLPKGLRKNFVPAPQYAAACVDALAASDEPLKDALAKQLLRMTGVTVPTEDWNLDNVPPYLFANFRVIDTNGKVISEGRDLRKLQRELEGATELVFEALSDSEFEQENVTRWDFGDIPEFVELENHGMKLRAYPAIVEEHEQVHLRLVDSPDKAYKQSLAGMRRLVMVSLPQQIKYLRKNLPGIDKMCINYRNVGSSDELRDSIVKAVVDRVFLADRKFITSQKEFLQRLEEGRNQLMDTANKVCSLLAEVLERYKQVEKQLKGNVPANWINAISDIRQQLNHLVYAGFVVNTPFEWLQHMPRYLKALERRLEKLKLDVNKDRQLMMDIKPLWEQYQQRREKHEKLGLEDPELLRYRWLLEELRVSCFAQELKTIEPVSPKRLEKQWQSTRKE